MPKIKAPTVREHRSRMETALVDAAEQILRDGGELTVGGVALRVGIARSSVYKYFASLDDLVEAVVARDFPRWVAAVRTEVEAASAPQEKILAYARANIVEVAKGEHGWWAGLSRVTLQPSARARIKALHDDLALLLGRAVRDLDARHPELLEAAVHSLVNNAIVAIDAGRDPAPVTDFTERAIASLVREAAAP